MQTASNKTDSVTKLLAILAVAIFVTGCVSAKSLPVEEEEPVEPVAPAPEPVPEPEPEPPTSWTVATGDNLWGIAGNEEVYNVPEKWPLIYKANMDQIEDADLIFPGQVLTIPRDTSQDQVDAAVNHAKGRGAWTVGPIESSDQAYLNSSE